MIKSYIAHTHDLFFQGSGYSVGPYTFPIPAGKSIGLIGINGAGKSSLLKLLAQHLPISSGHMVFTDNSSSDDVELKKQIGFMPDEFPSLQDYSGRNLIDYALVAHKKKNISHLRDQLIKEFQLDSFCHQRIKQLSLGQKQKLSLTLAMLHQPKLLICDEPLNGLDPAQQQFFWEKVHTRDSESTLIISSHNMKDIEQHCDFIYVIDQNKIVCEMELPEDAFLIVTKQLNPIASLKEIHPKIFSTPQSYQLEALEKDIQDSIRFSGKFVEVMTDIFRSQSLGEWQW